MKLLIYQNLSPRIIEEIKDIYSIHVQSIGLERANDSVIWQFALENSLTIVSKDTDFSEKALLQNPPPKVIWIKKGNCSTDDIITLLRQKYATIKEFVETSDQGLISFI